jgi:arsenite methyltransferase
MTDQIHEAVRQYYADAALRVPSGGSSCCGGGCGADAVVESAALYSTAELAQVPQSAAQASLGCGNPTAVADLQPGERVLDLGSGGGIDVLLSAQRVGPTGHAYGLDMTDEMLALAQANAEAAGVGNVSFLRGNIESIPLADASVDVVISNCVINLAADKQAVFREIARVLAPGGRMGISDIVADDALSAAERRERGSYVGCIAGALSVSEFEAGLRSAGLADVEVTPTHSVAEGMYSAIVRARRNPGPAATVSPGR